MNLDPLLHAPQYTRAAADKQALLVEGLDELVAWHRDRCPAYRRLLEVMRPDTAPGGPLAAIPWLPVGLFKSHRLSSVPPEDEFKVLTSSGTTGAAVSRVVLDRPTAALQTRGLAAIMTTLLGPRRLPMLIVDVENLFADPRTFSARGAGVLGMMSFGRKHIYALNADYSLRLGELRAWLDEHGRQPFLVFGFTFMVWQYLVSRAEGLDLSQGILVHSGGWKKLVEQAVDKPTFRRRVAETTGIARVHDFYGMVEQVGGVFLEGPDGYLYPPDFADVIARDPETWAEAAPGQPGVIQVLSLLPRSYPGHSILTEDLGVVHGIDDGCWKGKRFSVLGRVPRAELRGCSDTHAAEHP